MPPETCPLWGTGIHPCLGRPRSPGHPSLPAASKSPGSPDSHQDCHRLALTSTHRQEGIRRPWTTSSAQGPHMHSAAGLLCPHPDDQCPPTTDTCPKVLHARQPAEAPPSVQIEQRYPPSAASTAGCLQTWQMHMPPLVPWGCAMHNLNSCTRQLGSHMLTCHWTVSP